MTNQLIRLTSSASCPTAGKLLSRVLPPLLLLECVLGILGNGLALWIFCVHVKPWKSSTVLLFNLALADFLLNVALPFRASYYISGMDWIFGEEFCRICLFMLAMNRSGSIVFLMAIAVDRYLRVVHPHHPLNSLSVSRTVGVACALWTLTISLTAHVLSVPHQSEARNATRCESFVICPSSSAGPTWHKSVFILSFYLPLAVILFCSFRIVLQLRERQLERNTKIQRALRFIILVALTFAVCFLPSNIAQVIIWAKVKKDTDCDSYEALDQAFFITISLTYLNSMLDPIIYYFSSPTFKRVYKRMLRSSLRKKEEQMSPADDRTRDTGSQSLSQL
ncbi:hypothetical protein JZ751_012993 [Albula glossodonta]|uniref:G-protein coupled receptors family 1 profile domain-containing protein n=1 Tax=Albula glossodonta TaxID=121402 RepID=A0A8T2N6A8_9TELE|nr:hypothetical protein JZ751_012993 [Albula glossodonta]